MYDVVAKNPSCCVTQDVMEANQAAKTKKLFLITLFEPVNLQIYVFKKFTILKKLFRSQKHLVITSLSKEYVDVFVESSRIPDFRTPLSIVSKNLQQWIVQSFSSTRVRLGVSPVVLSP
ncbi:hypothetical protein BpHYR1_019806 [Brachionus plicatilis]|uniref:Uncharacterized protein n=1 Tax=Brachionus plicatilis TaxID=10195 RepID=A0A3M7SY80_BRAPC|nr:hypothetical protein BpHYR1_019806 [Brachionus plicatilis]